jgi:hypothetical protein
MLKGELSRRRFSKCGSGVSVYSGDFPPPLPKMIQKPALPHGGRVLLIGKHHTSILSCRIGKSFATSPINANNESERDYSTFFLGEFASLCRFCD